MRRVMAMAAIGVCAAVAGCTSTIAGVAVPADRLGRLPPPPIAVGMLSGLLLSTAEIGAAIAATGMSVWKSFDTSIDDNVTDLDCQAIAMPGEAKVYAGSGFSAIRGQQLTDPGQTGQWDHVAIQIVAAFASAGEAKAFFTSSSQSWSRCANRRFADPQDNQPDLTWTVGPVSNGDDMLTAVKTQDPGPDWACQRAFTMENNVIVDIETCSTKSTGPAAADIAHQIAAKIRRQ
jgi:hypothetical protein